MSNKDLVFKIKETVKLNSKKTNNKKFLRVMQSDVSKIGGIGHTIVPPLQ